MSSTSTVPDHILSLSYPLSGPFIHSLKTEFPGFEIKFKRQNFFQRFIHYLLKCLTCCHQSSYLTRYHTTMFGILWVADSWVEMADIDRYILLRHERVHFIQFKRYGSIIMIFLYLLVFFPVGLAYCRARLEWEAYEETIRATTELKGIQAAKALIPKIIKTFTSGDYAWMWPFPNTIKGWCQTIIKQLEEQERDRKEKENEEKENQQD